MTVRIGCGIGFWGDDITAPKRLADEGSLDYLVMDFLAELTMSLLKKQQLADPRRGFAREAVDIIGGLADHIDGGLRVLTNAGGVNPRGAAEAVQQVISPSVRVGAVTGDDVFENIDDICQHVDLSNIDDGRPFGEIADRLQSANAYLGAEGLVTSLRQGAQVVIAGRTTDTALVLAPLIAEYGWATDDWDRLASGIVAGHLIECSGQVTGGFHQDDWQSVPGVDFVGYPLVEVEEDGTFIVTKPTGTGGVVNRATVTEQLMYEIQDPQRFETPDVTVDFTSIVLEDLGNDRVRISGVRGGPPPKTHKVSMTFADGWSTTLLWPYAEPAAIAKAESTLRRTKMSIDRLGLRLEETRADIFGAGAIMGPRQSLPRCEPTEVLARFSARGPHRADIERLSIELAPAYVGAPGLAGFVGGGRGRVSQVISHWPALVPNELVSPSAELLEAKEVAPL